MTIFNTIDDSERTRLSSETAVLKLGNRYDLVLGASARARELKKEGSWDTKKNISTALAEIESGKIGNEYLYKFAKGNHVSRHHRKG